MLAARAWLVPERGLQAEYFSGTASDSSRPVIAALDAQPSTAVVARRWSGAPYNRFFVRWFGYLTVPGTGHYSFTLTSDDGSAMTIDGRPLIDHGGLHGPTPKTGGLNLTAGPHAVVIELTQAGGDYAIDWQWARDGGDTSQVPSWVLTPSRTPVWRVVAGRALDIGAVVTLVAVVGLLCLQPAWRRLRLARYPRLSALALFLVLACLHTWPVASDPGHLARHDNRDTILNEWIVAWVAHQAVHAPLHLFDANIFYPESRTLAYSEPMIVQAAIGAPLLWLGASPVFTYSVLLILGFALTGWSMALVVQRWTGDWTAGLVAGCVFGFSAHTLTRIPHLQTQHVEFLPMALLALDVLLRRPSVGKGVTLALWCTLQGLTSVYLLVITIVVMAAALLARPAEWLRRSSAPALKALVATSVVAAMLLLPFLLPYYRVSHEQGLSRSLNDAAQYSASWTDYLTTAARVHALTWSARFSGGTGLFPGALGLVLAFVAVARGVAFRDPRARMCLVAGVVCVYLSFGPTLPGYAALYTYLPLLQAIRATARFGYMATLAVAVIAGFGVVVLRGWVSARAWPAVAVLLVTVAALESLAAPLGLTRFDGIPPVFDRLPRGEGVVAVEVPFPGPRSAQFHAHAMLNSTRNWQPIVNGYSGFQPASFYRVAGPLQLFPADEALATMKEIGVSHVFVHTNQYSAEEMRQIAARGDLERIDGFGEIELYSIR